MTWRRAVCLAACLAFIYTPATAVTATRTLAPLLASNAARPVAPAISTQAFSAEPRLRQVRLSPAGTQLAYLDDEGAGSSLYLLDTRTQASQRLLASSGQATLHWSGDSATLFLAARDGVSAIAVASGASGKLAAFDGKLIHQVYPADPGHARHLLLDTLDAASGGYRLERIDAQGRRELLYQGRQLHGFLLDASGSLRFASTIAADGTPVIARRQGGTWQEVLRCRRLDPCVPVATSADASRLGMVMAADGDRAVLAELQLAQGRRRMVAGDPAALADVRRVMTDPGNGAPLFALLESPVPHHLGLTPSARRAVADIARRFPQGGVMIDAAKGGNTLLLTETGARLQHARYWLYHVARRTFEPILQAQRAAARPLPEAQLAQATAVHYRAADGVLVHGYLTLPPGRAAARVPLLTLVHGGPWQRASPGYTPLVQLLANRGVAVFEPNFRASAGYGLRYLTAAGGDLGNGRVQADILDGVRWLLAQGVGDRQRLAIAGHSFGGYATLLALTHAPDLFQFGMAMMPPPDFARSLRTMAAAPDQAGLPLRLRDLGVDLNDEAAMRALAAAAPVRHVAQLGKPLLIMAGGKDSLVDIAAVTDYVARLQLANKPVSLLLDPDEGHNPRQPLFRQASLYLLETLVHQHLGGPAPAAPSAELAGYLRNTLKAAP